MKIFYGRKWVNDDSIVLAGSKSKHEHPDVPVYKYIEYTPEVEQALDDTEVCLRTREKRINELEARLRQTHIEHNEHINTAVSRALDAEEEIERLKERLDQAMEALKAFGYYTVGEPIDLKKQLKVRGERMERMYRWMISHPDGNDCMRQIWPVFITNFPDSADWFNDDGSVKDET